MVKMVNYMLCVFYDKNLKGTQNNAYISKGTTIMLIPINFCNLNVNKVYAKMLAVNHKGIDF